MAELQWALNTGEQCERICAAANALHADLAAFWSELQIARMMRTPQGVEVALKLSALILGVSFDDLWAAFVSVCGGKRFPDMEVDG